MLDLVLTNVPDLCDVHVHGNVGRSDHASLGLALNYHRLLLDLMYLAGFPQVQS